MKSLFSTLLLLGLTAAAAHAGGAARQVLDRAQLAAVKVYGSGGVAGLEGYQSGVFVEATAAVLTVDSPVLGEGRVTLIDAFGDRHEGRVLGRDRQSGLVLVGYPGSVTAPGAIDFARGAIAETAAPVWVLSNAFGIATGDEPISVQRGRVAMKTRLPLPEAAARPLVGVPVPSATVVLLDAITSNPGAAGGVVLDDAGRPVGVLGAECRSPLTGAWINYALPAEAVSAAIERMLATPEGGRSQETLEEVVRWRPELREVGLALLPGIARQTPAYVEQSDLGSIADRAGCRPDDLIVAVEGATVGEVEAAGVAIVTALRRQDRAELTVLRDRRVLTLTLERDAP